MRDDTSSPLHRDAPDDWERLHSLLAAQPARTLSAEREAALFNRVEAATLSPRPLIARPVMRRGVLATGSALALTAALWFTGVFEGDAPQAPVPASVAPAASTSSHPRTPSRPRRPSYRPPQEEAVEIPPPPVRIQPDSVPAVPQHLTPPAADPYAPGPGRR